MSRQNSSTPSLLTSSDCANWKGVSLEHYLYPAYETPEHTLAEHHLCVYFGKPLTYEQVVKGKMRVSALRVCDPLKRLTRVRSHNCIYGDMILYPAGMTQKLSWDKQAEIVQLDIKPELIAQAQDLPSTEKIELIPQHGLRDPLIQQLVITLLRELQRGESNNNLYIESLFNTLCLHLSKNYSASSITIDYGKDGLPDYLLRRLDEYIQGNLAANITLADMAQVIGLSTSHLTRLFKQTQGMSLYQYVIRCRITHAKQLLKHKHLTIAEIAIQVGFTDQSHFTHHFKRQVGITPKAFRQL